MKNFGYQVIQQLFRCLHMNRIQVSRHISSSAHINRKVNKKKDSQLTGTSPWKYPLVINKPEFDWNYLCNETYLSSIKTNIENRKGVGNIEELQATWRRLQHTKNLDEKEELQDKLTKLAADIPNISSDFSPIGDESQAKLIETHGVKKEFSFQPRSLYELALALGLLRTRDLSLTTGTSTYYFLGDLAQLEQALIQYTLHKLLSSDFSVVTVPDIVQPAIIEGCGFNTTGETTQVYKLEDYDLCLAGTAEMPLSGFFVNEKLSYSDLPKKICAVSRCYRAETSGEENEKGIYRVHQFTKVEMFGLTKGSLDDSNKLMEEFLDIQKQLFSGLGLHFRVLEMPTQELGAPAHRKIDMEAWMPCKTFWGEISSTSNCTDFQSRRLSIKYKNDQEQLMHVHTVNGTACAIPRLIMNILETYQTESGDVNIPIALQPWMDGKEKLTKIEKQMKYFQGNKIQAMKKK